MDFTNVKNFMDALTSWRIPGNTIRIYKDGKCVLNYSSGYENIAEGKKMQGDEIFNIHSVSKPITVAAALQLYERGKFLLDEPLYYYIPEFREMYVKCENGVRKCEKHITIRHLFTMTSGFDYSRDEAIMSRVRKETNGRMDTLAVVKSFAERPLCFEPGEKWGYGLSHDILAAVVEVISGKKFRDYVKENIFLPLGMDNSYYHNENLGDRLATQYIYINSEERDIVKLQMSGGGRYETGRVEEYTNDLELVFGSEYDSGGGGVSCTADDYGLFAAAMANNGLGTNGERILSRGSVELMKTNQLTPEQAKTYTWRDLVGYGYGLGVRTMIDRARAGSLGNYGEFGWSGSAGATAIFDTEINLGVFYCHHMVNPMEDYYMPRLRNTIYSCL